MTLLMILPNVPNRLSLNVKSNVKRRVKRNSATDVNALFAKVDDSGYKWGNKVF
jgi:hypothetical protein